MKLNEIKSDLIINCPFCPIFKEGQDIIDIAPLNPTVPGHRLVIPREHVKNFSENPEVSAKVMEYASKLAKKMGDVNMITSKGKNATQSVFHLHIHLIPRFENDGVTLPWTNQGE